ncbi:MAG: ParB/RepB/Spo0J family partition protein [Eubacteriales bacterium]|nr:ParB/RepB/Spo0J family partition protein [Oscillospiraceae bacterium]MBR3186135.1 ParB/RepB/Spo0J family partition protein [Oscillospiraceae bacterium]MDO4861452.1 ParB/RepB/Spo0J family partition protein [Eubacteriales bacterium]
MAAKEKKGLGTGLGVLFGEDTYTDENELKQLPVSRLEPRREQPRTVFDDAALQELAESLRRYGVIQPVTARKLDNGFYQIIAGERRWRAARLAGLEEIPVRVIEADDRRTAELALVENLQREDLNPIEEARGYQALIDEYGMTQEEAAQSVGRSRPAITNALRLLSLSPAVLSLVEEGKLSAGHARALLPITEEKAQKAAADEVLKKSLSVRRTEQLAARQLKEKKAPETAKGPDGVDYAADVSETLSALLGRRVRLVEGRSAGRIELSFYGADDREALIAELEKFGREKAGKK